MWVCRYASQVDPLIPQMTTCLKDKSPVVRQGHHATAHASVADPDPGSGAFSTPGSWIQNRFFPDPVSQTPFLRA
jgi:hypothetical protein